MKNLQKGFIAPVLLVIIALLVIGGGVYVYKNKKTEAPIIDTGTQQSNQGQANTQIPPATDISMTGWKTYINTRNGYQLKYPADWQTEENLGVSVRIFNPRAQGKPDTDQPSEAFGLAFKQTPCKPSDWKVGFGLVNYKTACVAANPMIEIGMLAFSDQNKIIEDQILSTLKFTQTTPAPATPTQTQIIIPGMKQYTDSNFGFSFWYPNTWTVQNSATRNNYAGGSVQKTLTIAPPGASNGDAITIDEFYSPTREVTIPRDLCSPMSDSFVAEHRYYFDTNTHTWMVEVPAYTGQSEKDGSTYSVPASTKAADVSQNTMGGLHMLGAGCSGSIIPLSAKNFVVFTFYSRNVGPYYINIAKTITATDPSVATPVSLDKQIQTITNAGVLLGAIGTKIGQWYVTSEHVYTWTGDIVAGANPSTFRLISTYSDGTGGTPYATDGVHIYSAWFAGTPALSGADPSTFIAIRQQYQIPYAPSSGRYGESFAADDNSFAKDKSHVWYQGKLIPNADPNTFIVTGNTHVENASGGYTLAHDSNHTYGIDKQSKLTIDGVTIQ